MELLLLWEIVIVSYDQQDAVSSNSVSVIILVITNRTPAVRGCPILLITRMITDRISLHSVLLPLLIEG